MEIKFSVGKKEKHQVEFNFDRILGQMHFKVDGEIVKKQLFFGSFSLTMKREIIVGRKEKHKVEIKMKRPLFFAGFRTDWNFEVIVDGKTIKTVKG